MTFYERHRDDEIIDEISFTVVPRFKTSGITGDEWRVSTRLELRRKGTVLVSRTFGTMGAAVAHLPWLFRVWPEELEGVDRKNWVKRINLDKDTCHQPGCPKRATVVYAIKEQYAPDGRKLDRSELSEGPLLRAFCARHSHRGDAGRDDSDKNYTLVRGARRVGDAVREEDKSPALAVTIEDVMLGKEPS